MAQGAAAWLTLDPPTRPKPQAMPRLLDLTRRSADAIEAAGPGGAVDVADMAKRITSDVMVRRRRRRRLPSQNGIGAGGPELPGHHAGTGSALLTAPPPPSSPPKGTLLFGEDLEGVEGK